MINDYFLVSSFLQWKATLLKRQWRKHTAMTTTITSGQESCLPMISQVAGPPVSITSCGWLCVEDRRIGTDGELTEHTSSSQSLVTETMIQLVQSHVSN